MMTTRTPCPKPCPDCFRNTLSQVRKSCLSRSVRTLSHAANSLNAPTLSHSPTLRGWEWSGGRGWNGQDRKIRGAGLGRVRPSPTPHEGSPFENGRECQSVERRGIVLTHVFPLGLVNNALAGVADTPSATPTGLPGGKKRHSRNGSRCPHTRQRVTLRRDGSRVQVCELCRETLSIINPTRRGEALCH
jgi:hypothetical protein